MKYAQELFEKIPNQNVPKISYSMRQCPWGQEELKKIIKVVNIEEGSQLTIIYVQPVYLAEHDASLNYIKMIICNKCKGSLFHDLFNKNLIMSLGCDWNYIAKDNCTLFDISFELTKKGFEQYKKIPGIVSSYLEEIRNCKIQEWYYNEIKTLAEADFKYHLKEQPFSFVENLADSFGNVREELTQIQDYWIGEYCPERIKEQQNYLICDNSYMFLCSNNFDFDNAKRDYHFGTEYNILNYDQSIIKSMNEFKEVNFTFPERNNFIPKNYELQHPHEPNELNPPQLILKEDDCHIWYKPDKKFKEPRAVVYFQIYHFDNNEELDPIDIQYSTIWYELFDYHFVDKSHMIESANIDWGTSIDQHGITFSVCCYNDSLKPFIKTYCEKQVSFRGSQIKNQFNNVLDSQKESINSAFTDYPINQATSYLKCFISTKRLTNHQVREAVRDQNFEGFKEHCKHNIYDKLFFEGFFSGNIMKEDCLEIYKELKQAFFDYKKFSILKKEDIIQFPTIKLKKGETRIYKRFITNEDEKNSAIAKYYQADFNYENRGSEQLIKSSFSLSWLGQYLSDNFYNELRTEQQIGYDVSMYIDSFRGTKGVVFSSSSSNKDPNHISEKIDEFIEKYLTKLEEMTEDNFDEIKRALETTATQKTLHLEEDSNYLFYNQILSHRYNWNWIENYKKNQAKITKEDVIRVYKKVLMDDRQIAEVHMVNIKMKENYLKGLSNRNYKNVKKIYKTQESLGKYNDFQVFKKDI